MITHKPEDSRFRHLLTSGLPPFFFEGFEGALLIIRGTELIAVYDSEHYTVRKAALDYIKDLIRGLAFDGLDFEKLEEDPLYTDDHVIWSVNREPEGDSHPNLVLVAIIRWASSFDGNLTPYLVIVPDDRSDPLWKPNDPLRN